MIINKISDKGYILALIVISLAYYLTIVNKMFNIYLLDMGRDLYVSLRVMRGDLYLRDFDYPYGFLMPYIFSMFYGLLGVSIRSFNIGWMVMQILVVVSTFITARLILPKLYSFVCASFLLLAYYALPGNEPNHIGGQLFGIISLYLLLKYFLGKPKPLYLILSAIFCGLVSGVKLNMGLATFVSNAVIIILFNSADNNRLSLARKSCKNLASYTLIFFIAGILPYLFFFAISGYHKIMRFFAVWFVHGSKEPFSHLKVYYKQFLEQGISLNLIKIFIMNNLNILLIIGMFFSILLIRKSKSSQAEKLTVISIVIFSFFKMHEYLLSATYYSLTLWFFSPAVILSFWAFKEIKDRHKAPGAASALLTAIGAFIFIYCITSSLNMSSKAKYYLGLERAKVYLATRNDAEIFTDTVNYLQQRIESRETVQSLFFTSAFEYLLDAKEAFWESFNGSATGKILDYSIKDSILRLESCRPRYVLLVDFRGGLDYSCYKDRQSILDYVYSNYEIVKEFKAGYPSEEHQLLNKVTVYKLKGL